MTRTGLVVGTAAYLAPEQARGYPEQRSDLYAVGCVLFELRTGRLPFTAWCKGSREFPWTLR
ncbi:hypothetical protein ACFYY1_25845 [Streptomyces sp. NPDC001890]|uniref:hypothetical protein n=1 Tax=Streptomyces sp. NPDC001890 TaxID=3364620 RepID=UPI003680C4C2